MRAEEYRTAFLETGGTEEEWAEHNIKITVGYEIKQQSDEYLSFIVLFQIQFLPMHQAQFHISQRR